MTVIFVQLDDANVLIYLLFAPTVSASTGCGCNYYSELLRSIMKHKTTLFAIFFPHDCWIRRKLIMLSNWSCWKYCNCNQVFLKGGTLVGRFYKTQRFQEMMHYYSNTMLYSFPYYYPQNYACTMWNPTEVMWSVVFPFYGCGEWCGQHMRSHAEMPRFDPSHWTSKLNV